MTNQPTPNNPLQGITLQVLLTDLVARYGWDGLAQRIDIRCFKNNPSMSSSLSFLRRTPWARSQLEQLWIKQSSAHEPTRTN